jgi:AcrR family transcriptional regulator
MEFLLRRSQQFSALGERVLDEAIDILDLEMEFHRRATQPVGADRAEIGILVGEVEALAADRKLGMADPAVARLGQPIDLPGAEGPYVEIDRRRTALDDEMRRHGLDFCRVAHSITLTDNFNYVTVRFIMSQEPDDELKPKRGRPRSEAARQAILRTAHDMLVTEGLGRLTIEAVAERAHVGKPTIYRYWKNAQELAMAALMAGEPVPPPTTSSGRTREKLYRQMDNLLAIFATPRGRQIALTMAAAEPDSEMAKAFRTRVMLEQREAGRVILMEAAGNGEIQPGADMETVLDMLYAPVFYRLLVGHLPLTEKFGRAVVDSVWRALEAKP